MNEKMSLLKPDWLEAKQRMADWWAGKRVDRVVASVTAPVRQDACPAYINKSPEKYVDDETVFHNLERSLNHTFWGGEAFPCHWIYFGPMFTSAVYFGAEPIFTADTTWYDPCFDSLDDIIAYEPDPQNKWWRMYVDMTKKTAERSAGRYLVSVGGVGAIIDTLALLLGNEKFLCALKDEPEKVIQARDALLKYGRPTFDEIFEIADDCNDGGSFDWLSVWTPGKATTNQCDLCVMISPEMFDRFVFDDMKVSYEDLEHGFYHLDGEGEIMHLDSLLRIDKLHMIQWVPSTKAAAPEYTDPMNWIDLFRRIQDAGRRAYIYTPHYQVKELLNKIDRDLVYLSVNCPDEQTAYQVLRELEK